MQSDEVMDKLERVCYNKTSRFAELGVQLHPNSSTDFIAKTGKWSLNSPSLEVHWQVIAPFSLT